MQTKTLFSQHYLETRLPQHAEWDEDPTPVYETLRALWDKAQQFGDTWSEAQTEDEFIKPVLTALGWTFTVQPKSKHAGRVTRPDYALFADAATQQEAYPLQGDDAAFYSRALAIAEAKYWERPLSQKDASGRETWKPGANPSHQMVSYLVGTRAPWGILTNGRVWRLYSREVSSTASEYYEVDLAQVFGNRELGTGDSGLVSGDSSTQSLIPDYQSPITSFKRFWLFFRRDAFIPDAQGKHFVQRVHEGSATYAREISDKLKELVYAEVMPEIAAGFIAYRREQMGVQAETEASLREVYRASLSLLYKLLFLLYAEARGLLPVENPGYREQSLTALAQWAADRRDRNLPLSTATHAAPRYEALLALFRRIDQGDPSLSIPRYNGGLFDPENPDNAFLERHRLSDRAVACAVDILVRDAGQPVDYAYISVRNLGAIYEGLLENKLVVEKPDRSQKTCQVSLVNDKGERKATGSYYTPDYIVEYIVQQTLGPVLEARAETFAAAMGRVAEARRALARTADPGKVRLLRGQLDAAERDAREVFLGIKVLDPAMGSGHFLVNAVDFLTDGIIREMQAFHDAHPAISWDWNPIQQLVERVRAEILDEMARQGIALDPARLDDTALLTRLVMKRCIYGVDLNKMAVELAKLSLWLHSFTVGAPLSFLDHHLRWGNSLIGTDVRTVEAGIRVGAQQQTGLGEVSQFGLFAGPFAGLLDLTTLMVEVVDRADATLSDVQRSAGDFAALQASLTPYKQALDMWVSQHFGNTEAGEFLRLYGNDVLPALRGEKQVAERYRAAIARAHTLWEEKRFFHWDLEFPEVFVDLRKRDWAENPGFDAVIGNPPWLGIRTGSIEPELLQWLRQEFVSATGQFDLAAVFLELGSKLVYQKQGNLGFVVPKRIASNESYADLRRVVCVDLPLISAVDLAVAFEGVNADALMLISGFSSTPVILFGRRVDNNNLDIWKARRELLENMPFYILPVNSSPRDLSLLESTTKVPTDKLGKFVNITRGAECGMNHAAISLAPSYEPLGNRLPLLHHLDIDRYELIYSGWIIDPTQIEANKLKEIAIYQRAPKLLVRFLSADFIVTKDETGYASTNLVYHLHSQEGIPVQLSFLLAILSSKLMKLWYRTAFQTEEVKFPHVQKSHLEQVSIPRIDFTTPAAERARLFAEAQALAAAWVQQPDAASAPYPAFLEWSTEYGVGSMGQHADVTHDLLASLAEEMLALNKDKQAEMRGFLTWLERHTGAKVSDLTGKSSLQAYLGDYQKGRPHLTLEDVLAILRKNRRKLAADPDARAFQETLEREYAASLAKLLPRKQRLAATDRLIDLLVYRLYGLTEEEVRIVEGKGKE